MSLDISINVPSMDEWLKTAKEDEHANECGMYLFHNGVVRQDAKAKVRENKSDAKDVRGMFFDYNKDLVEKAIEKAYKLPGIKYIRVWLAKGELSVGDDIMLVLIGGDIRPNVIDGLQSLVGEIKNNCVIEKEIC